MINFVELNEKDFDSIVSSRKSNLKEMLTELKQITVDKKRKSQIVTCQVKNANSTSYLINKKYQSFLGCNFVAKKYGELVAIKITIL